MLPFPGIPQAANRWDLPLLHALYCNKRTCTARRLSWLSPQSVLSYQADKSFPSSASQTSSPSVHYPKVYFKRYKWYRLKTRRVCLTQTSRINMCACRARECNSFQKLKFLQLLHFKEHFLTPLILWTACNCPSIFLYSLLHCLSSSLFRQFWHCTFMISLQCAHHPYRTYPEYLKKGSRWGAFFVFSYVVWTPCIFP